MSVRLGILGFAHGHAGMYCAEWRRRDDVRLAAGWDHDPARAARAEKDFGIKATGSVAGVLARVDAVLIAAETVLHADLVEQAAAAGKAIVLQKPLALTMEQADRIVETVESAGVPFTMAWQMRVDGHNLQMKALLSDPRFGRLLILRRRHCLATQHMAGFENLWHNRPELNRDIFADDAAHPVDFAYWMLGMPESVVCEMGTLLNPSVPNDTAVIVFRWHDGTFGEIVCSFVAPAGENSAELTFSGGAVVLNFGDAPTSAVPRPPGGIQLKWFVHGDREWTVSDLPDVRSQGERIAGLAAPIADFLHGRRPPIATAREGRDVLKLILACYASAESGRRVIMERKVLA
ncbi:MAG: Gfo/Idh/MocA family oxidoreductase [Lentisphaerae bacterium]|nr:Gfo/Idh/MocA family oxidoreductase [Lentisphaerota bacterium]